jgi:fatty-acid peroxygenase
MSLMHREAVSGFMQMLAEQWRVHLLKWEQMDQVNLFAESRNILCRAACQWAGVPLREDQVATRASDLSTMVDAFGGVGLRNWKGRRARSRSEDWIKEIVEQVRAQQIPATEGSALQVFSTFLDVDAKPLDAKVAAVEILNVIRPLVAISWFNTFLGLALHLYPQYRSRLQAGGDQDLEHFVQEVRRYFPFTPFLGARVRKDFEWQGYHFKKDQLTILDVYGTNRDERQWERAEVFWPERFKERQTDKYGFIPQGGGDFLQNHRCAGEWITIGAMKVALDFLVNRMEYQVPEQDLSYRLDRMPANPRSGFVMSKVKRRDHSLQDI